MNEDQVKELTKYRIEQRKYNHKFSNYQSKQAIHEMSKDKPPQPPAWMETAQYSILVEEKTLEALKDFSLEINNNNTKPYNDLIIWLIDFYHENIKTKEMLRINQLELERQQDLLQQQQKQLLQQPQHL